MSNLARASGLGVPVLRKYTKRDGSVIKLTSGII
jgi:hypothetical protein